MKVFYLHIPKTGGQTLATRLASAFPLGRSSFMSEDLAYPQGVDNLKSLLAEKDFVESHVAGAVLSEPIDADILATVRSPVDQIVSNYLHIKREPVSPLYRSATRLTPLQFFERFGDFLGNFQSRYLASAFFNERFSSDRPEALTSSVFRALDRVRWMVPTEAIEDFTTIWSVETRLSVPSSRETVNVAPNKENSRELREVVQGLPHLYSVDQLLWTMARSRYRAYRDRVLRDHTDAERADNLSRAYWEKDEGIWLLSGWHFGQRTARGVMEWWAGPDAVSEVVYKKRRGTRYLGFNVQAVCGIRRSDIVVRSGPGLDALPVTMNELSRDEAEFRVDLHGLPDEGSVFLCVPEVWSPIMLDPATDDIQRKSFVASDWCLLPGGDIADHDENRASIGFPMDTSITTGATIATGSTAMSKKIESDVTSSAGMAGAPYVWSGECPKCKICGSDTHYMFALPSSKMTGHPIPELPDDCPYFECNSCSFLFCDRHDSTDHKTLYDAHYWEDQDPDWGGRVNQALRLVMMANNLLEMRPWEMKILDFGCGMGTFVEAGRKQVQMQVWGTDIIKPRFGLEWFQEDPPAGFFDAIVSCEVIEHLPQPVDILKKVMASLRPGGVFAFQTAKYAAEECGRDWWYLGPGNGHISLYSDKAFDKLAEHLGVKRKLVWNGYAGLQAWQI